MYELLIECRRFGEKQADGSYVLKTNEVGLASRSGLSRETVSREMGKIKEYAWIDVGQGRIVVKDVALLEQALGGEV
jgi:CRP-like cAMP-binding protein